MAEKKKYVYVRKTFYFEGKQYEVSGKTEKEAVEKLALLKQSLKRGERTIGAESTVDAWYKEWKSTYKDKSGITSKSLGMYDEKYNHYIKPAIGKMKLKSVKDTHLQKILNEQAGKSFSHVSKLRMVMQAIFKQARISRLIIFDPSENLVLPENKKASHRSITEEERKHILKLAETHRAGLWVLTMLYAGLRPGETVALLWKDIDFDKNEIHVYKAMESGFKGIKSTKTEAGVRDIPMRPELREKMLQQKGDPFTNVFLSANGKPHTNSSLRCMWRSFRRALDISMGAKRKKNKVIEHALADDFTPYCLRHTFCTDLQKVGVPINVAKELMGHSDISVTANIYTHKDQKTLHENMKKFSGVMGNTMGNSLEDTDTA